MNIHLYLQTMRTRDESKENAIRENAIEMIVNDGFDGLSMQKLAKASGISPATIYIYFKNREDMLNKVYMYVQKTFFEVALDGFNPDLSFETGLWMQWKNRLKFINEYPKYFRFQEQFRNSPLINSENVNVAEFKLSMRRFVKNAIMREEIKRMEPEIFWSVAYGTFYTLVKFHINEKNIMGNNFKLTEPKLKQAFDMVVAALRP